MQNTQLRATAANRIIQQAVAQESTRTKIWREQLQQGKKSTHFVSLHQ